MPVAIRLPSTCRRWPPTPTVVTTWRHAPWFSDPRAGCACRLSHRTTAGRRTADSSPRAIHWQHRRRARAGERAPGVRVSRHPWRREQAETPPSSRDSVPAQPARKGRRRRSSARLKSAPCSQASLQENPTTTKTVPTWPWSVTRRIHGRSKRGTPAEWSPCPASAGFSTAAAASRSSRSPHLLGRGPQGMVSTDHAQTGEPGRQRRPSSNRLMPPPRFSRVHALDPASSASDLGDPSTIPMAADGIFGRDTVRISLPRSRRGNGVLVSLVRKPGQMPAQCRGSEEPHLGNESVEAGQDPVDQRSTLGFQQYAEHADRRQAKTPGRLGSFPLIHEE